MSAAAQKISEFGVGSESKLQVGASEGQPTKPTKAAFLEGGKLGMIHAGNNLG